MEELNWNIKPLWKIKLTDIQFEELKLELYEVFLKGNDFIEKKHSKEAVLFFAEWWKREYNGGPHKKNDVAYSVFGENNTDEICNRFFKVAKCGIKTLKIDLIRGFKNERHLDTLLLQGGLPIKALSRQDGINNRYGDYLLRIVKYILSHNVRWDNSLFIQNFNEYISPSFRNESMYELTLQIVRAAIEGDENLLPFDSKETQFKPLRDKLIQAKDQVRSNRNPFKVNWFFKKICQNLKLCYSIECKDILSEDWINTKLGINDFARMELIVNGVSVQKYIRKNNGDYKSKNPEDELKGEISDFDNSLLNVQIVTNSNRIFDISILNAEIPDFSEPILLTLIDNTNDSYSTWKVVNNPLNGNRNVILCTADFQTDTEVQNVNIDNFLYNWIEFDDSLKLAHNDEIIEYSTSFSLEYSVDYSETMFDWIQKSNYSIVQNNPIIKVYDSNDEFVPQKRIKAFFRINNSEWQIFNENSTLTIGLISFKIEVDKIIVSKRKLYYTGNLNLKIENPQVSKGIISWIWNEGSIIPIKQNENLNIQQIDNLPKWEVSTCNNKGHLQETISFELIANCSPNTKLKIDVSLPFKGLSLINPYGEAVRNEETICINALFGYRCILLGKESINVYLQYFASENAPNPTAEQKFQFYKGNDNKLQVLWDDIQNMFRINSHSIIMDNGVFRLVIGEITIYLKPFNVDSRKENNNIHIYNLDDELIDDYNYNLYAVPVNCNPDDIKVIELAKFENYYAFEEKELYPEVIVFSEKKSDSLSQLRPRYYNYSNNINGIEIRDEIANELHIDNINNIKAELLIGAKGDSCWKSVIKYFEIAVEQNLYFEIFNCFKSISWNKDLRARFAVLIIAEYKNDRSRLFSELVRYENEFGQAFHWIDGGGWVEAIEWYIDSLSLTDDFYKIAFENMKKNIISLLSYRFFNKDMVEILFNWLLFEKHISEHIEQPSFLEIQNEKQKFNNGNGVFIPEYLKASPKIPANYVSLFKLKDDEYKIWGGLLLSPLLSALAFCKKNEVFDKNSHKELKKALYYSEIDNEWYFDVFGIMVRRINSLN